MVSSNRLRMQRWTSLLCTVVPAVCALTVSSGCVEGFALAPRHVVASSSPFSRIGSPSKLSPSKLSLSFSRCKRNQPVDYDPSKQLTSLLASIVGDKDGNVEQQDRTPSMAGPIFGVIKAMLGTGMLALPSGLAAVTNHPDGLWPAHILLLCFSVLSGYTFFLYGRLTHATQATSLGEIWKRIHEDVPSVHGSKRSTGLVVSLVSFIFCFGACLTFSLVFGDMISSFLRGTTFFSTLLPTWALTRQASILAITSAIIFPLCNLSSLAALAPVSVLGVIGSVITTAFLAWRCPSVVATSPYASPGFGLLTSVTRQPSFSTYSRVESPAPLVLFAMSCVALMAHFSAPDFYHAITKKTIAGESGVDESTSHHEDTGAIGRFATMTLVGYTVVAILNSLTLAFGFLTFGGACEGIILNNFSSFDWGANLSRLLVGVSVIGSYPLLMGATTSAAVELFHSKRKPTREREFRMKALLLSVITAISMFVKDAGFVLSFNGAIMGSNIVYTIPALLFLKQISSRLSRGVQSPTRLVRMEQWLCRSLVLFGVGSAVVGGVTTIISSFFAHLLQ